MRACPYCGVEIEDDRTHCPLCGRPLDGSDLTDEESGGDQCADERPRPGPRARMWLWEVITLVMGVAALIVAAADFAYGFDMSWSIYPLSGLGFVWLFVSALIWLGQDIPLAYAAVTVDVLLFLLVLDIVTPGEPWFVPLALPVTLLVAAVGGAAAAIARGLKLSVIQTIADGVLAIGVFLVGLEIILHLAFGTPSILSWSIVAFAGCLSIALLLLVINQRLRQRHADFKRVFHL